MLPEYLETLNRMAVLRLTSALLPVADVATPEVTLEEAQARFKSLMRDLIATLGRLDKDPPAGTGEAYAQSVRARFLDAVPDEAAHLQSPRPSGSYDVHAVADMLGKMLAEYQRIYATIRKQNVETMHEHVHEIYGWLKKHGRTNKGRDWILSETFQILTADRTGEESL